MNDLSQRIKDKFKYVLYSPMLDKIILIDGGKSEHMSTKGKSLGFYYCYGDEKIFGKYMSAKKLEELYPVVIGEVV